MEVGEQALAWEEKELGSEGASLPPLEAVEICIYMVVILVVSRGVEEEEVVLFWVEGKLEVGMIWVEGILVLDDVEEIWALEEVWCGQGVVASLQQVAWEVVMGGR